MKVMNKQRDFGDMSYSSTVREKSHVRLDLHLEVKVANTPIFIGANLFASAPIQKQCPKQVYKSIEK